MKSALKTLIPAIALLGLVGCEPPSEGPADDTPGDDAPGDETPEGDGTIDDQIEGETRRTPAEWEPQAAVWLQWPQAWEGNRVQDSFVAIVEVVSWYEDVELIADSAQTRSRGEAAVAASGADTARVTWHVIDNDNSWMRDNGPRYVEVDGELIMQNWLFDGWGGGFGQFVEYDADNVVPDIMGEMMDMEVEQVNLIHERGDLEVNGTDTALVSWSVLSQRNPDLSRAEITATIQEALGVDSVIYTEGFDPMDGTRGHVDGMARFISEDTIIVGDDGSQLLDDVYAQIVEQRPDLNVERMASPDAPLYLNWLVGDGFVLAGSGRNDDAARDALSSYFPGRDIHFVDIDALWNNGGGVHCVTNDQPEG